MADNLASKTRDELYELATAADIPGRSTMDKDELLAALQKPAGASTAAVKSDFVTPRVDQGEEHPEHRPPREIPGAGGGPDQSPPPLTGTQTPSGR